MKKILFYPTFRSNDFCEYSKFWRGEYYTKISESPPEVLIRAISDANTSGVGEIVIRGGEPLVRKDLPEILDAIRPNFHITLRTNGLLLENVLQKYVDRVDLISLLLYHPEPQIHDRILGVEGARTFRKAAHALRLSGIPGELIFPVTRETITHLPEALEYANACSMPLRIEPFYVNAELAGFERGSLDSIRYMSQKPGMVYSDHIQKILQADVKHLDRSFCSAGDTVVTIEPDGKIIEPCVYSEGEIGKAGSLRACASCTDWGYLLSSSAKMGVTQ